ncbi:hypothetical protein OWV82_007713 [Melia azedarach]|uniref:Uncharacterized protein n=1 Tax=Melia azedarach TaxID=155640 RepID=A0ACC1Y936_MELAZ|nr:hypothetical protein OWV82_007713 [Melia azedarach]
MSNRMLSPESKLETKAVAHQGVYLLIHFPMPIVHNMGPKYGFKALYIMSSHSALVANYGASDRTTHIRLPRPSSPSCQAEAGSALYLTILWQISGRMVFQDYSAWVNIPFTKQDVESFTSSPAAKVIAAVASIVNVWKRVCFLCG